MSYWLKTTYELVHLQDLVDMEVSTWICSSLHISLINLHFFPNSCHVSSVIILFISPAFPIAANSVWEVDLNTIWSWSRIVSSVPVVANCTFPQVGRSVSSISPVLPQHSQVYDAASLLRKSVLQAGWLWSMLFTGTTIEGHLDLNGLAMHH